MYLSIYICYFGVREPLVQTQVLPYLREILKGNRNGAKIALLTFEPSRDTSDLEEFAKVSAQLSAEGIEWDWLPYHKRLSVISTSWDILRGTMRIRSLINRYDPAILHARVHVPALMAHLARKTLSARRPRLLFDIRGFFPEEYVDAGVWTENGLIYRIAKTVERRLLSDADGFVVLTEKARDVLFPGSLESGTDRFGRPVKVIPCCVDLEKFGFSDIGTARLEARERLGIADRTVIVYIGSFGGWYLTRETIDFLVRAKVVDPSVFALILTQSDRSSILEELRAGGFGEEDLLITRVPSDEIPSYVCAADFALSFILPCYSKQASSPTKNAEYLACGVPIIANSGIGDTDELIIDNRVGVLVEEFTPEAIDSAIDRISELKASDPELAERCRRVANSEFDLGNISGKRYRQLYRELLRS